MPFRALMHTLVAVGIMLLAIALWAGVVGRLLFKVAQPATQSAGATSPAIQSLRHLFRGTLMLSLILVLLVLVVGVIATWRQRLRHKPESPPRKRVPYVDAWKLAGQRMKTPEELEEE